MIGAESQNRIVILVAASAIGIAASWMAATPFGFLAPSAALLSYARGRMLPLIVGSLAIAFAAVVMSGLVGGFTLQETAASWVAVFAVGFCLILVAKTSAYGTVFSNTAQAHHIIESMPGHAWATDPKGRFTYVSNSTLLFLGATATDIEPRTEADEFGWRQFVHPEDYGKVVELWRNSLRTGDNYEVEHRVRRVDGVYRWFRSSSVPVLNQEGHITGWYGTTIDIDEQKKVETALLERETELAQLVEMVPSHLWRLAPDGNPIFFNKRMIDFIGHGVEQTGKPVTGGVDLMVQAVHPSDATAFRMSLEHSLTTGCSFALRYRLRRADGVFRWMSSRAEALRDQNGTILQWYGLCHDIDDQMKIQTALSQSQRQLQQLIDTVPALIWTTTSDGRPTYVNKRFTAVTGATLEDITAPDGSSSLSVIHPEYKSAAAKRVALSFRTGEPYVMRYRQLRRDGSYRWTETRAEPFRDGHGTILQWYGVSVDIDDLVTVQEALKERERFLWQLVETLPAMVDCASPEGEPVYRSQQLREFLGYDLENLDTKEGSRLSGTLDRGVHPDDLAVVIEKYARSLATGEPYVCRHRLRRYTGEYHWVETRAAAMRNSRGAIVQWNIICLDIDGEVKAREELRSARDSLARASQAAGMAELSASIAHEVNQPLAAIVANSNACYRWLSSAPANVERAKLTAERITRDAKSAADVVGRIRALFQRDLGPRVPESISQIISEVCRVMADEAVSKGIRVRLELSPELPYVSLDRVQIQQVIANLIRNGMEAMDTLQENARLLKIRTVYDNMDEIRVEFRDAGPGIIDLERAFEPFFSTKQHGMGMGLAICRSIIESHGGRLWAKNDDAHGAVLAFTLPVSIKSAP